MKPWKHAHPNPSHRTAAAAATAIAASAVLTLGGATTAVAGDLDGVAAPMGPVSVALYDVENEVTVGGTEYENETLVEVRDGVLIYEVDNEVEPADD